MRVGARLLLGAWAALAFVVAASLMAAHTYTLPTPAVADDTFVGAIDTLRERDDTGWLVVHVLYAECRCSQRIFDHLLGSTRPADVTEKVLLVGQRDDFAASARARGIAVVNVTPRELAAHYRIESAPLLLVVDPAGDVRYAGGYTERKQGPEIEDVELIERLLREESTTPLPLFGCAVSERLQAILDPLGIEDAKANP
jgi:hypothetical protein